MLQHPHTRVVGTHTHTSRGNLVTSGAEQWYAVIHGVPTYVMSHGTCMNESESYMLQHTHTQVVGMSIGRLRLVGSLK